MKMKQKKQVDLFSVINVVILTGLSLLCLMPIINVLAISFSERAAVEEGKLSSGRSILQRPHTNMFSKTADFWIP